jgi:type II secretory pathway component GspD/PulD (secretin)
VDQFSNLLRGKVVARATPATSISQQVIVLKGPEDDVNEILQMLQELDTPVRQDADEFTIYDVKFADPRSLREELVASISGLRASVVPASVGNPYAYSSGSAFKQSVLNEADRSRAGSGSAATQGAGGDQLGTSSQAGGATSSVEGTNPLATTYEAFRPASVPMRLILRGSPAITAAARAYAATLDVAPKQIALEVRVAELSREDALTLGFDWNILDTGGILTSIGLKETPGSPNFNSSFRGGHSLTGQLDQLLDKRHLIARPNLLALDGRESEVFIGDIVKYIQSIQTDDQGRQQITLGQDRVGVRLPVLARAGADGNITLDIQPAVSTITGFLDVPGGGQVPQISIRTTQSSAVIKSGETIALGGLIREEDRKQVSGVPILKDLPIVGALFRKTQNSLLKTEIVFFLTAKIVDANDRANAAAPKSEGGQQP